MTYFQVGDKVKRIQGTWGEMTIGDIGTIIEISPFFGLRLKEYPLTHGVDNFELIKNNMIDFKIKGTKLPTIPVDTEYREYRVSAWEPYSEGSFLNYEKMNFISYGYREFNGDIYILAESFDYVYDLFYMFKESDLHKLIKNKLSGYTLSKVTYKVPAENIMLVPFSNDSLFIPISSSIFIERLKEAGVLNHWFQPVYEYQESFITDRKGRKAKVLKDGLIINGEKIFLSDLERIKDSSSIMIGSWVVKLTSGTFTIGCWEDITLDDINKAIIYIKSL